MEYPQWAHYMGFVMSASSMMWIPGYALYYLTTTRGTFKDVSSPLHIVHVYDEMFVEADQGGHPGHQVQQVQAGQQGQ